MPSGVHCIHTNYVDNYESSFWIAIKTAQSIRNQILQENTINLAESVPHVSRQHSI